MNGHLAEFRYATTLFERIMNRFCALQKSAFDFGTGKKLYPAEIHTIAVIGNRKGIIARDIAATMGITKGAVSQMISRLEAKNLVEKRLADNNDKEFLLYLSDEGRTAYRGHEKFHSALHEDLIAIAAELPPELFAHVSTALEKIDSALAGYQKNR